MDRFYLFIIRNDVWIYILCGLGLVWYLSEYVRGRSLLRRAMFGLERERGQRLRNTAVLFIVIFGGVIGLVTYVNLQVAPTLPEELLKPPTPTPNIFATPLASPTPLGTAVVNNATPTPAVAPTITLAGAAPPAELPPAAGTAVTDGSAPGAAPDGPTPTPFINCNVDLNIQEPANNAFVSGVIAFSGTADTLNFGYYSLEANGPQTSGQWASLLGRTISQPVRDGFLGNVNLGEWGNGPYLIRLTAVDANDNLTGQCVIQVTLNN